MRNLTNNALQNLKRFVAYLFYVFIMGYLVIWGIGFQRILKADVIKNFEWTPASIIFPILFPILIGMLIALPQFIVTSRKLGTWGFDWIRFLAVGIPALVISLSVISVTGLMNWIPLYTLLCYSPVLQIVSGILFGYNFLASFGKQLEA